MCSALYLEKDTRDVGEVSWHNIEYLRNLIIAVEIFLDLVNAIENTFETPFLQNELYVSFYFSLKFFVCFCT